MTLTDWRDHVPRWVFWAIVAGVPLVWLLGPTALIVIGAFVLLPFGLLTVGRLGDVAKTPLSFCLPGFRESLRRRYFSAAVLIGVGTSMISLPRHPFLHSELSPLADGDPGGVCLRMAAAFLLGMAVYLIVGTRRFVWPWWTWGIIRFLTTSLLLVVILGGIPLLRVSREYSFVSVISIPVCAVISLLIWLRMGDMARVKRAHRMMLDPAAMWPGVTEDTEPDSVSWTEGLFQRCVEHRRYLGMGRYLCGSLYEAFDLLFLCWKWVLLVIVVAAVAVDFIGSEMAQVALILSGWAVGLALDLPTTSVMLLPGGRRERYWATLAVAFAGSLLLIGIFALVGLLSELLAVCLAVGFSWDAAHGLFSGTVGAASILLPCLVVPAILGVRLMDDEYERINWILGKLVLIGPFLVLFWYGMRPESPMLELFVLVFALGWILFLFTLRATCRRGDLGQRRPGSGVTVGYRRLRGETVMPRN